MNAVFLIFGEDQLSNHARQELFSVWEHRADAEDEKKRLEAEKPEYEFQIEEIEINQPSNDPIF